MSYYVFDAAQLLETCLKELQQVIQASEALHQYHYQLYDFREALSLTEQLLFEHVQVLLEQESFQLDSSEAETLYTSSSSTASTSSSSTSSTATHDDEPSCLSSCVDILRSVVKKRGGNICNDTQKEGDQSVLYPRRNATDSLLFRLIVALQLCLVRIGDARFVIVGRRLRKLQAAGESETSLVSTTSSVLTRQLPILFAGCCAATWAVASYNSRVTADKHSRGTSVLSSLSLAAASYKGTAKMGLALFTARWLNRSWGSIWMSAKIQKSTHEIENWNQQWHMVQSTPSPKSKHQRKGASLDAAKSRRLIDYALHHVTPELTGWQSQGELRFVMLKRAMDVFYASVGTAMKVTGTDAASWQMTLVTAAVSSFYTLTGARRMAEEVTSSSDSARNLIHHAWGMVSLPALKTISLKASRLVKGAAVADRLEIAGVPCFVLSREPAPELAAATRRYRRSYSSIGGKMKPMHTLSTIDEQEEHLPDVTVRPSSKPFARSSAKYRQRDVILHLTGGGFFAHIIASDLLYLLDWSASTGAVVICPEYALLPQHQFPDALLQVEAVYKALLSGQVRAALGFEANRIVLTGESAGGNLAAALCVKLCMDADGTPTCLSAANEQVGTVSERNSSLDHHQGHQDAVPPVLPCALVLSCPVLNLSLELSHSRVVGNQDPVLPSGLLSAISDAYLPRELGISKKDPLASPFYAPDSVLERFPPTLVFASSNDPLLDDSVVLNQRLRCLGVESDLRAAQNLPHAYLGLGTAGFPEAQEVQRQLVDWLNFQLTRDDDHHSYEYGKHIQAERDAGHYHSYYFNDQ